MAGEAEREVVDVRLGGLRRFVGKASSVAQDLQPAVRGVDQIDQPRGFRRFRDQAAAVSTEPVRRGVAHQGQQVLWPDEAAEITQRIAAAAAAAAAAHFPASAAFQKAAGNWPRASGS